MTMEMILHKAIFHCTVQLGADNINNYIDAIHLPNLAGRTYFINLKYQIKYKSQK